MSNQVNLKHNAENKLDIGDKETLQEHYKSDQIEVVNNAYNSSGILFFIGSFLMIFLIDKLLFTESEYNFNKSVIYVIGLIIGVLGFLGNYNNMFFMVVLLIIFLLFDRSTLIKQIYEHYQLQKKYNKINNNTTSNKGMNLTNIIGGGININQKNLFYLWKLDYKLALKKIYMIIEEYINIMWQLSSIIFLILMMGFTYIMFIFIYYYFYSEYFII